MAQEKTDHLDMYKQNEHARRWLRAAQVSASLFSVITACVFWVRLPHDGSRDPWLWVIFGCWVLVPPAWFACEFFFLYPKYGLTDPSAFEHFKYGQDVTAKLWAAVVALLAALLLNK